MTTKELATQQPQQPRRNIDIGARGLQLQTLDDLWRFAQIVKASGLAPKGVDTEAAIFTAIQMGLELGLTPMAAIQNVAVINGRPSVWGDAMLAVCRNSGLFDEEFFKEWWFGKDGKELPREKRAGAFGAACRVRRLPAGQPIEWSFDLDQAATAGLTAKPGPWKQYPARMLQMRARSFALRDAFSDALKGCLCAEEMGDVIDVRPPRKMVRTLEDLTLHLTEPKEEPPEQGEHAEDVSQVEPDRPHVTPPRETQSRPRKRERAPDGAELPDALFENQPDAQEEGL
jgi:hypothetical protein